MTKMNKIVMAVLWALTAVSIVICAVYVAIAQADACQYTWLLPVFFAVPAVAFTTTKVVAVKKAKKMQENIAA